MLKLTSAQYSCQGDRDRNDDAFGKRVREHDACFVISDGVGSEAGGAWAAQLAVHWALQQLDDKQGFGLAAQVNGCVDAAEAAILAEQRRVPERARMAATMVALYVDRPRGLAQWIHVGDSRLYHFRQGVLVQRTIDHSLATQLAGLGLSASPGKAGMLSRALGHTAVDTIEPAPACPLQDGDAFLLCTDGFWHALPDPLIENCLQVASSVNDWIALLAEQVHVHGTRAGAPGPQDNYSALAVWVGEPDQVTLLRK